MAQPLATAKRVKTAETDWPLRPHVQEQRQNVVNVFVPFNSSTSAANNRGIVSVTVSIPFDVKSIEIDAVSGAVASGALPTMLIGIDELAPYFGQVLHALTPNIGSNMTSTRHEFQRPVPMQGQKLTFNLYNPSTSAGSTALVDYTFSTALPVCVRLSFHRNTK